jgi:GNAT superfamily N-acetyltransferase
MGEGSLIIRYAEPADEARWRQLWAGYNAHQDAVVPETVTAATWRRILDPAVPLFARVAVQDGIVAGFAVCVLHEGTWVTSPICYLEDLFVDQAHRRHGIGRALIDDLLALGRAHGWSRLYWHTDADNETARRVYDSVTPVDKVVRYRLSIDQKE